MRSGRDIRSSAMGAVANVARVAMGNKVQVAAAKGSSPVMGAAPMAIHSKHDAGRSVQKGLAKAAATVRAKARAVPHVVLD